MWSETSQHKAVIIWLQRGASLTGFERDPQAALCIELNEGVGITKPRVEIQRFLTIWADFISWGSHGRDTESYMRVHPCLLLLCSQQGSNHSRFPSIHVW